MATTREKMLLAGLGGGAVIVVMVLYLIMPSFDTIAAKTTEIDQKKGELATIEGQIATLSAEVAQLEKVRALPNGLDVRKYEPGTLQQNVKVFLDLLVTKASETGNDLISLTPWTEAPSYAPEAQLDAEGKPLPPKEGAAPQLDTFGYTFEIRGSYDSVIGFLSFINHHNELMEVHRIKLENETGEDRQTTDGAQTLADPFKPIKLTVNMVIFLQPK